MQPEAWSSTHRVAETQAPPRRRTLTSAHAGYTLSYPRAWKIGGQVVATQFAAAFIIVRAASSISKAGSTISGNTPHLVIVRVDPGYEANPGHAGTGTVAAILC